MHLLKDVVEAEYLEGYQLLLHFDDGIGKIVNLESYLDGEIFLPLQNVEYCKRFVVNKDTGTVEWENQADFSPDLLYQRGTTVEHQPTSVQHE